jgi:magnesium transporter
MRHGCEIFEGKLRVSQEEVCPITVFISPDEEERKYLVNQMKIDEHTLQSALDPDELARLEFEPDHIAIIFKIPKKYVAEDQFLFRVNSIGAFLFQDRLIFVVSDEAILHDQTKMIKVPSLHSMILKLLYLSIFHFREHLKIITMISDEIQNKINQAMENRYLINLFSLQKSLVYFQNFIGSNSVLIDKLKNNSAKIGFSPEEAETLDDISVENNQCYKQAEIYTNILASLMDARASIVSNNLNVLMKTLNIITIGIMVPTLVVSIFSMNVQIPLQSHPLAFFIVLFLSLMSVALFMLLWRYRNKL